jgi:protease stability complex PrcB-like protein
MTRAIALVLIASTATACRPTAQRQGADSTQAAPAEVVPRDTPRALPGAAAIPSTPRDRSSLEINVDNADLLVVDPVSRQTGAQFSTGAEVQEIPQSGHFVDAIDNDVTGEPATSSSSSVGIREPAEGTYQIQVRARPAGPKEVSIHAFSFDGRPQPKKTIALNLKPGEVASFSVAFSKSGPLSFMRIGSWASSGIATSLRAVIRTEAEWRELWSRLNSNVDPTPEPPRVDFAYDVVIAVALGQRPSGGHAIRVDEIRATDTLLTVSLTEVSPGTNCVVSHVMTQPVDVVRAPAVDVPRVEYVASRQTGVCP